MKSSIRSAARLVAAVALLALGPVACGSFDVPDYDNESLQGLVNNPTPSGVATLAQGLMVDARGVAGEHTQDMSIIGRETYNLSVANGTLPTYLAGPLNTGVFFVLFTWRTAYQGIRDANILLHALDNVGGLLAAKSRPPRVRQTIQVYLFLHTDVHGTPLHPVDVDRRVTDLGPIATKAEAYPGSMSCWTKPRPICWRVARASCSD